MTEDVSSIQPEVQRRLGRCLLRLQQYELLLKAIVAHHELEGPADKLESLQAEKVAKQTKQTLGGLVTQLTGSFLSVRRPERHNDDVAGPNADVGLVGWISFRTKIEMPEVEHARLVRELGELVQMRNELVHHFIERFDVWTLVGCTQALEYLLSSYEVIDRHYASLASWAKAMENGRALTSSFLNSESFEAVLMGKL
ncbi:hypothetical protein [Aquabacterium sp.]|uniref:hypothetical protein n=1 Tax=Aquabacterium sp. TaxID=1872578 RepID=UPI002486DF2F|nr:hypothetical protein [Aquabacterium sp.]MDI1258284.1 hypothetical protein [Aquabacterium sp.]